MADEVRLRGLDPGFVLKSAYGEPEVGIREGTAAWLDVSVGCGTVHNSRNASDGPGGSADTVETRAHTG